MPQTRFRVPNFEFSWPRRALRPKHPKIWLVIGSAILLLIVALLYWWFHPAINIHSTDTWTFIIFVILLPLWLILRLRAVWLLRDSAVQAGQPADLDSQGRLKATNYADKAAKIPQDAQRRARLWKRLAWLPLGVFGVFIIGWLLSSVVFPGNAGRYAQILTVDNLDFATDIQEVDYSQIPVIDRDSAALLGDRVMGEIPEYVSQFTISSLYSQINYQGRPVRVSPLAYADFFKWMTNSANGLPAYVLVDMASQDTRIVRLDQGMRYSESEPFDRNIDRYIQLRYPFYMFDQKSFEIDDSGHPWWVCPVQTRRIGLFGGTDITRVVLCDACSGECTDYSVADVPGWVDRVYPADLLIQQYNWFGTLSGGWLNSWLGQSGVVQVTGGTNGQLGYNYIAKDDAVWVYSGVTSATNDESIVGFVLINQRTAEAHYYAIAGATETSAMSSAEGQVQHLGYVSTFPLLVNIHGQPTYFMALKDNAGLVKMYAMIDIQRYQNVAVGDTVESTQQAYLNLLGQSGIDTNPPPPATQTISGVIDRLIPVVIDGNSHFYLILVGDTAIYDCALPELTTVLLAQSGDSVQLSYTAGSDATNNSLRTVIQIVILAPATDNAAPPGPAGQQ